MNNTNLLSTFSARSSLGLALRAISLSASLLLLGCSGDEIKSPGTPSPTGDFELRSIPDNLTLIEGDSNGLQIPISLDRKNGHASPVKLSLSGATDADMAFVESSFSRLTLTPSADQSQAILRLDIADLPITAQQRQFVLIANDGMDEDRTVIQVNVVPVDAPDVYLLIGQSNMVGFSGDGTRQALPGGADEPHPRITQLNVSKNDRQEVFVNQSDFTSSTVNVVQPSIVTAEDPLHVPLDPNNTSGKDLEYIGLGMSFAKRALPATSRNIVLVPAAWSGSAFCAGTGPNGQWNADPVNSPFLGNTWLYDRAVTRANLALAETGGILRGILWHQGESDSKENCGALYAENLENLIKSLRTDIMPDRRGQAMRQADSNIPFVIGTMSKGADERGDLASFSPSKQLVDDAHRTLPTQLPHVGLSIHDDLTPANGYFCGNTSCVHFGPAALREMGSRYYDALIRAAQ